jgi:hypothetical protein
MTRHAKCLGLALLALGPIIAGAQDPAEQPAEAADPVAVVTDPVAEYEALLRETRGLELYNALRGRQIAAQQRELVDVQVAIEGVPALQLQLPPLLIRMVDGLAEFVERDVPFLTTQRQERLDGLYTLIEDPDLNDSIKLSRVLESWQLEVEYGREYQADAGEVSIDGASRNVDFVVLGRSSLLFQTADDEAITGAWDSRNDSWVILGSEHRNPVRQAIRMVRSQIAPDLLLLPTVPPQVQ